jgi:hypothetical protein
MLLTSAKFLVGHPDGSEKSPFSCTSHQKYLSFYLCSELLHSNNFEPHSMKANVQVVAEMELYKQIFLFQLTGTVHFLPAY